MASTTKDFNGTDNDPLETYDSNFNSINTVGSGGEIFNPAGEQEVRAVTTFDREAYYYNIGSSALPQSCTINAKCGDDGGGTSETTTPTVCAAAGRIGYHLNYSSDGSTVSSFQLRYNGGTTGSSTFKTNLTVSSVSATSSIEYKLEVTDNGGDPQIAITIGGNTPSESPYTDVGGPTNGQPGMQIYCTGDTTICSIQSATFTQGAAGPSIPIFSHYYRQMRG